MDEELFENIDNDDFNNEAQKLATPEPPLISKITHHSLECTWKHVKSSLPRNHKWKYVLQERRPKNKSEWFTIYT